MKLPYPNVGALAAPQNPPEYLDAVLDCVSAGAGQPMILSDEVWIANMKRLGYPDRIANDYYNMGCVEIMFGGRQPNWGVTEPIAFPMLLEPVFAQIRAGTFYPATYEEFRERYLDELRRAVEADYREALAKQKDIPGKCYEPFGSLMIGDCLQRERDMFQGGAELGTHWSFYAYGLGTLADSLAAVKQAVYTDHLLSDRGAGRGAARELPRRRAPAPDPLDPDAALRQRHRRGRSRGQDALGVERTWSCPTTGSAARRNTSPRSSATSSTSTTARSPVRRRTDVCAASRSATAWAPHKARTSAARQSC